MTVRILEDQVVNRIAAGEVVERPASVVKELVENALDAGATHVDVTLKDGGRALVRVADDGSGMDRHDAMLCIERHATSKIRSEADLFAIGTLGFRGEALPSIASVSRFELLTRRPEDDVATRLRIEGGRLDAVEDAGAAPGTTIEVRSLFWNVPARRKFLRTEPTELGHCLEAVTRQALGRPDVDFRVTHDGRELLRAPKVATRADRARALLGEHGRALVPAAFEAAGIVVEGLVSPAGVHKADSGGSSYLFVNGRYVRDAIVRRALNEAYVGIVPKGRHPVVVLEIRLDPALVDVNVHPAKTEVRFRDPMDVVRHVSTGLRAALEAHGIRRQGDPFGPPSGRPAPQGAPPGREAPLPALPFTVKAGEGRVDLGVRRGYAEAPAPRPAPSRRGPPPAHPDDDLLLVGREPPPLAAESWDLSGEPEIIGRAPAVPPPAAPDDGLLPVARFRDLRVIGQHLGSYVLCEARGVLLVVDQHAANERITLHRLRRERAERSGGSQRLLTPLVVELTLARATILREHLDILREVHLEAEPFGPNAVAVTGVPPILQDGDIGALVREIADQLADGRGVRAGEDVVDQVLATMAFHHGGAVAKPLTIFEMRALLAALDEVDPAISEQGRPVAIRIDRVELERRFRPS